MENRENNCEKMPFRRSKISSIPANAGCGVGEYRLFSVIVFKKQPLNEKKEPVDRKICGSRPRLTCLLSSRCAGVRCSRRRCERGQRQASS